MPLAAFCPVFCPIGVERGREGDGGLTRCLKMFKNDDGDKDGNDDDMHVMMMLITTIKMIKTTTTVMTITKHGKY